MIKSSKYDNNELTGHAVSGQRLSTKICYLFLYFFKFYNGSETYLVLKVFSARVTYFCCYDLLYTPQV